MNDEATDYTGDGLRTSEFVLYFDIAFARFKELLGHCTKRTELSIPQDKWDNAILIEMSATEVIVFSIMVLESCGNCIIRDHKKQMDLKKTKGKKSLHKTWSFILSCIIGNDPTNGVFLQKLDCVNDKRNKLIHAAPRKIEITKDKNKVTMKWSNSNSASLHLAVNAIHTCLLLESICNKLPEKRYYPKFETLTWMNKDSSQLNNALKTLGHEPIFLVREMETVLEI